MMNKLSTNLEKKVIQDFGDEWNNFNQSLIKDYDLKKAFICSHHDQICTKCYEKLCFHFKSTQAAQ